MFYNACRCGGLPEYQAKVLYAAVRLFGSKWDLKPVEEKRIEVGPDGQERVVTVARDMPENVRETQDPPEDMRKKLEEYIRTKNPSIAEIGKLNPDAL